MPFRTCIPNKLWLTVFKLSLPGGVLIQSSCINTFGTDIYTKVIFTLWVQTLKFTASENYLHGEIHASPCSMSKLTFTRILSSAIKHIWIFCNEFAWYLNCSFQNKNLNWKSGKIWSVQSDGGSTMLSNWCKWNYYFATMKNKTTKISICKGLAWHPALIKTGRVKARQAARKCILFSEFFTFNISALTILNSTTAPYYLLLQYSLIYVNCFYCSLFSFFYIFLLKIKVHSKNPVQDYEGPK